MPYIKLVIAISGLTAAWFGNWGTPVMAGETGGAEYPSPPIGLTIRIDDGGISFSGRFVTSSVEMPGLYRRWALRRGNQPLGARGVDGPDRGAGLVFAVTDSARGCFVTARALRRAAIRVTRRWVVRWAWRRIETKGPTNADRG